METDKNTLIQGLIKQVEEALHRKPTTPKDFELASDTISRQTNVRLSKTTLMRMWGYVKEDVEPREFTLTTLARFCGYASCRTSPSNTPSTATSRATLSCKTKSTCSMTSCQATRCDSHGRRAG